MKTNHHATLWTPYRWGTVIEQERRRRIKLVLWAYAWEIANDPLTTDAIYDHEAYASDINIQTGRYDEWWKQHYKPYTAQWVHSFPGLDAAATLYQSVARHDH